MEVSPAPSQRQQQALRRRPAELGAAPELADGGHVVGVDSAGPAEGQAPLPQLADLVPALPTTLWLFILIFGCATLGLLLREPSRVPTSSLVATQDVAAPVGPWGAVGQLPRVALAVNCAARHIPDLAAVIAALPEDTRANLTLFFAVYGEPEPPPQWAKAAASFNGSTALLWLLPNASASVVAPAALAYLAPTATRTWTTGRNELLRKIYAAEVARGQRFTYWVMGDADIAHTDCADCPPARAPDYSSYACCLNHILGPVLTSDQYNFATLGQVLAQEEWEALGRTTIGADTARRFVLRDCTDAQLHAFHREAAPLMLPYHEEFEASTWVASQAMLFHHSSGCLAGAGAVITTNNIVWDNEHAQKYASPDWAALVAFLEAANPELHGLTGGNAIIDSTRRCYAGSNQRGSKLDEVVLIAEGGRSGTVAGELLVPRVRWTDTCAYAACNASLRERFVRGVGEGAPEAPPRPGTQAGLVWGWQALSAEGIPWWSKSTNLTAFSQDCSAPLRRKTASGAA